MGKKIPGAGAGIAAGRKESIPPVIRIGSHGAGTMAMHCGHPEHAEAVAGNCAEEAPEVRAENGFSQFPNSCPDCCPGCAHRRMSQAESLSRKSEWIGKKLSPWLHRLEPICPAGDVHLFHYRNKVCLSAAWSDAGWQLGLLSRDRVVNQDDCPVHSALVNRSIRLLKPMLPGGDRFSLVFYAQSGTQVTLVVKQRDIPPPGWLTPERTGRIRSAGIEGLWVHANPGAGKRVFAKNHWRLLWGRPRSRDEDGFVYGPLSFRQPIAALHRDAMASARAFLSPAAGDRMIDLYCGGGAGLAMWLAAGCRVMGVELGGEAVECARINAPGAEVLRGACRERIPQLSDWAGGCGGQSTRRLAFVNPPRTGLEPEVTRWLAESYRPRKMAYLSCSAGTLQRDLGFLENSGYRVCRIIPYDFFPWTGHVECLALIQDSREAKAE